MIDLNTELKHWWERWLGPTPSPFYLWEPALADLAKCIEAREKPLRAIVERVAAGDWPISDMARDEARAALGEKP